MSSRNKKNASSDPAGPPGGSDAVDSAAPGSGANLVASDTQGDESSALDSTIKPEQTGEAQAAGLVDSDAASTVAAESANAPVSGVAPESATVGTTAAVSDEARQALIEDAKKREMDALRLLQQATQETMGEAGDEGEELSEEERRYLNSHLKANPLHEVNERLFTDVKHFKQMNITFYNLRANSKAFLSIRPDQVAMWSEGGAASRMVGLSFSTSTQNTLYLRNFLINAREMYLETYQDCTEINIGLYVRTDQKDLKGRVDLPPGASVTLQSRCDRSSIIGLSSFGIDLE